MQPRRLLVVSRFYPPTRVVAAQRAVRLVRGIGAFGWKPYVLTAPPACQIPIDAACQAPAGIPVVTAACCSIWHHETYWNKLPRRLSSVLPLMGRAFARATVRLLPLDIEYPWVVAAVPAGIRAVRRHKIDLIWATAPPVSALCVARQISRRTGIPYVVDFRDVSYSPDGGDRLRGYRRSRQIERVLLRDAVGLTYTAPSQRTVLTRKHPKVERIPHLLLYNWFDDSEVSAAAAMTPSGAPTVVYGGLLYDGTRRVDGFFDALALLKHRGSAVRFKLYCPELSHCDQLAREAERRRISELVGLYPQLSRQDFTAVCRQSDILLLLVGHDKGSDQHAGAIPGKLYEYFAASRPILVLGPAGCEAANIVNRVHRGIGMRDDQPEEIAQAVGRLLNGHTLNGPLNLSPEGVREFQASQVLARLAGFLGGVLEWRGADQERGNGPSVMRM